MRCAREMGMRVWIVLLRMLFSVQIVLEEGGMGLCRCKLEAFDEEKHRWGDGSKHESAVCTSEMSLGISEG